MTKHTAIIFLSILIIIVAVGGFPSWLRTIFLVLSALGVAILAYLSSVLYCSNCKKLIEDAENALPVDEADNSVVSHKIQ
jgi:hypothetical protein